MKKLFPLLFFMVIHSNAEQIINHASPKTIYDIVFHGYTMWLGTSGGLYNINIRTGKQRRKIPDVSFPDPSVKAVAVDSSGCIWAGSEDGYLLKIDRKNNEYLNKAYMSADWQINDLLVYKSYLIVASDKGVSILDIQTNKVLKNASQIGTFTSSSVNVLAIYNNRLYLGCERGLAILEGKVSTISEKNFYDPSIWKIDTTINFSVKTILSDIDSDSIMIFDCAAGFSNLVLYTSYKNGLVCHLHDSDSAKDNDTLFVPSEITTFSVFDINQNIWIGTKNDFCYLRSEDDFIAYGLSGPSFSGVNRIHVDGSGQLWVAPFGEIKYQIDSISPWWLAINRYSNGVWDYFGPKEFPQMGHMGALADASGICETSDGNMWFGYSGGAIKRYDPSTDDWYHYCNYGLDYGEGAFVKTQGMCPIVDWGKCDAIAQDSSGYIWFSSWNNYHGTLICYKPETNDGSSLFGKVDDLEGRYKRFPPMANTGKEIVVTAIGADRDGNIIYGTEKGELSVIRHEGNPLVEGISNITSFSNLPKILQVEVLPDGTSLVLSSGAVYLFDPNDNTLVTQDEFDKDITSISLESERIYWYGTSSNGLVRYDVTRDEKTYFNRASGLISDAVNDVFVDKHLGNVWVASSKGISQLIIGYNYTASDEGAEIVFPNPFSKRKHTKVRFQNLPPNGTLLVHSLAGALVVKPKIVRSSDEGSSYIWTPKSSLSTGTYFYSFVSSEVKSNGKLLIVP